METITDLVTERIETHTEFLVTTPVDHTLFIQDLKDTSSRFINEVQHILVIWEGDELPKDSLAFIFLLLEFEHEFVELLLQSLIGVVNTELITKQGQVTKCVSDGVGKQQKQISHLGR